MDEKRILLIEDDLHLRELYARVLSKAGFHITMAVDGQEGLMLIDTKPDLILLDIMMPRMNGMELLRKLKSDEKTKDLSIVLLTNLGQASIIQEAMALGARGYLMKVRLLPEELTGHVKKFLEDPTFRTDLSVLDLD